MIDQLIWDAAFDVARHFHDFGSYGSRRTAACRALRRRRPELTPEEADALFDRSLALLQSAAEIVDAEKETLWKQLAADGWDHASGHLPPLMEKLHSQFPDVPHKTCSDAVGWIWYWRHLR